MNTRESNTGWIVAGVLLVLLLIVGYLWLSSPKDVPTALQEGSEQVDTARAELAAACTGANADQEECDAKIEEVRELLAEFEVETATSSMSGSATTTY